jgi:hypothetical protein
MLPELFLHPPIFSVAFRRCSRMHPCHICFFELFFLQPSQTSFATRQLQSAYPIVSTSCLHMGHSGSEITFHLTIFSLVGRILLHACHINILTTLDLLSSIFASKDGALTLLGSFPPKPEAQSPWLNGMHFKL